MLRDIKAFIILADKHRWPGQACVLEGPEEFQILA
jgi:hypothetical protein